MLQLTEKKRVHSCDNLASQSPINTKAIVTKTTTQQQLKKIVTEKSRKFMNEI